MNITICAQNFDLSPAIREHVAGRLDATLRSFEDRIVAINVFLRDINGPRGGRDKQVLLRVKLGNRQLVTIETTRHDLYVAISVGSRRARRGVRRTLKKMQRLEKQRLRNMRFDASAAEA